MGLKRVILCGMLLIFMVGLCSFGGPDDPGGIVFRLDKLSVDKQGESNGDEPYLITYFFQWGACHAGEFDPKRDYGPYWGQECWEVGSLGRGPGNLRTSTQSQSNWAKKGVTYSLPGAGWDYKECFCCPPGQVTLFKRNDFYTDKVGQVAGLVVVFLDHNTFTGTAKDKDKMGVLGLSIAVGNAIRESLKKVHAKLHTYASTEAGMTALMNDTAKAVAGANVPAVFQKYAQSSGSTNPDSFGGIGLVLVGTFPGPVRLVTPGSMDPPYKPPVFAATYEQRMFVGVPTASGTIKLQALARNKPYVFSLEFPNSLGSLPTAMRYQGKCTLKGIVQVCD